ncbi:MAG: hypothetical protein MK213_06010 [Planctomycetes bacterium]|nr:hypothetical protein [Planctomycetota bacterium]
MTTSTSSFMPLLLAALLGAVLSRLLMPTPVAASGADSGHRYVAATGPYQNGVSLLYVLDQKTQHVAVYEAQGGAPNSHEITFVGSRNIALDLLLDGFNDSSPYSYAELLAEFEKRELVVPETNQPELSQD